MSLVAEAVYNAFGPDKLNYELLGQGENVHMHWHIFPRRKGDTPEPGPVWKLPREEMYAEPVSYTHLNKKRKIYRDSVGQQADKAAFYQRGF